MNTHTLNALAYELELVLSDPDSKLSDEAERAIAHTVAALRAQPTASAEPVGEVVVSWTQDRSRIVAVTRQDEEGRILSVIAVAPVAAQPSGGCNGMPAYEGPLSAAQAPAASADQVQALREALHAAAEYIGDRSAGSSTFWDLYDAAMQRESGGGV